MGTFDEVDCHRRALGVTGYAQTERKTLHVRQRQAEHLPVRFKCCRSQESVTSTLAVQDNLTRETL